MSRKFTSIHQIMKNMNLFISIILAIEKKKKKKKNKGKLWSMNKKNMNKINYNKKIHHKCDETGKSLTYFIIKYIYFIETK